MAGSGKTDILLLGSGGREHALLAKLAESPQAGRLWVAPGNGGMWQLAQRADIDPELGGAVSAFAREHGIGLVVIPRLPSWRAWPTPCALQASRCLDPRARLHA